MVEEEKFCHTTTLQGFKMNSGNAHTSYESQGFSSKCLDAEIFRNVVLSATDAEVAPKKSLLLKTDMLEIQKRK